jgi:hypothetical protein
LIFGILFPLLKLPSIGLGGAVSKLAVIPPLANGIYGGIVGILLNFYPYGNGGLFNSNDGILLILFGLFSANSLSAKVPCF